MADFPRFARHVPARRKRGPLRGALALTWLADRRGFLTAAFLQIIGALSPSVLVLAGQYLLSTLTRHRPSAASLVAPVAVVAVVTALTAATGVLQQQQQRLLGERVAALVWEGILEVTGRVPLEMYESSVFYDHLQRIRNSALSQPVAVTSSIFGLIGSTVGVGGLLIVLLTIEPLLVPLLLLAGAPTMALSRRSGRLERAFLIQATPLYRAREYLRLALTGRDEAKEIRVFGAESALRKRHTDRRHDYDSLLAAHVRRRQLLASVQVAVTGACLGGSLAAVVWLLSSGRIGLAAAAAAVLAVRFLSTSLDQLFRSLGGLIEASVYLSDLDDFSALGVHAELPAVGTHPPLRRKIEVRDLCFTYPGAEQTALDHVDMELNADEIVALVGENGSGKTTLAKLVAGLYRPNAGTILWDGVDTATIGPAEIRAQVSVIFQDFVRYKLSAQDNVGLGDPAHAEDREAARAAADLADATKFLDNLPFGFDTILSKEYVTGVDLSMGQWQRVALARALRKPASLIILDEPSASLDPRSEAELFADIRATLAGRSALLISHRFSSVRLADRIYVLQDGRIQESGTHDALMREGGLYAELFTLQARTYL